MISLKEVEKKLRDQTIEEGPNIEFKRNIPKNLVSIAKVVAGMANTDGGFILFGIHESVKGISVIGVDCIQLKLISLKLRNYFGSQPYKVGTIKVDGKTVLYIQVKKTDYPVYFQSSPDSERLFKYKRIGATTSVADKDEDKDEGKESAKLYKKIYKYMNLESFVCSLYGKNLRFSEPSKWPDRFETRFYCANYENVCNKEYAQKLYATCVTRTKNNEAAWKVYARNEGLSCHCVQLELDIVEFRKQLWKSGFIIDERAVQYTNEDYILKLHKKEFKHYKDFFIPFTKNNYIKLLSLKRDAYKHENEIRFFAIPKEGGERTIEQNNAEAKDITIEWHKVIKNVRVDKKCSFAELIALIQACHIAKINPVFSKTSGIKIPSFPQKYKENSICFELYDIDELPEPDSSPITIE